VIAEHVDRKATNQHIAGKTSKQRQKPPNWKSKNSPEAAVLTTSNDKYHWDYFHKDGHTEDR
jgi:hypothetical protein